MEHMTLSYTITKDWPFQRSSDASLFYNFYYILCFYFYFADKERQKEQIEVERSKIEENIDRLSKDIEKEEDVKQRKREVFIEDLDQQTEEKKAANEKRAVIDKAERFRGTNALASKLSKHLNLDEPVISVSYNLQVNLC